jgi:hypothetical protein
MLPEGSCLSSVFLPTYSGEACGSINEIIPFLMILKLNLFCSFRATGISHVIIEEYEDSLENVYICFTYLLEMMRLVFGQDPYSELQDWTNSSIHAYCRNIFTLERL